MKQPLDKLIYIEWEDAHGRSGWHSEKEMKDYSDGERAIVREIGWIHKETKDFIVLYGRVIWWHSDDDIQYGLLQKIPKTWVRKRKVIKL